MIHIASIIVKRVQKTLSCCEASATLRRAASLQLFGNCINARTRFITNAPCQIIRNLAMAFVPGFEYDIFISYARDDNATADGAPGWIARVHQRLEIELRKRTNRNLKIWRDEKEIANNQEFDPVLKQSVEGSAILLAFNSNAYKNSVYFAAQAFAEKNLARGYELLDASLPPVNTPNENDPRSFAWYHPMA
jgi:hypothetical protein